MAGCAPRRLYAPAAHVWPEHVGYGGTVSVRAFGSELMSYRFMGAIPAPDGSWIIRLEPLLVGRFEPGQITADEGDIVRMGPIPSIDVKFMRIATTELTLRALRIHDMQEQN